jgi:hypothetical protein
MTDSSTAASVARVRKTLRFHPDTVERVKYWSTKRDLDENDYLVLAVEEKIARENGDYDLPTLEIQRLGQLIDEQKANTENLANLERTLISGLDSLISLTRGDSYLLDGESGELGAPDPVGTAITE